MQIKATRLKRKLPDIAYPDKPCKWCGTILIRIRQSLSEWKKVATCGKSCAGYWTRNRRSKAEIDAEIPVQKICAACKTLMVRRPKEHKKAWLQRKTCNKSCAAVVRIRPKQKIVAVELSIEIRSGVKRYTPGTPEFNAIAAVYLERGF